MEMEYIKKNTNEYITKFNKGGATENKLASSGEYCLSSGYNTWFSFAVYWLLKATK